MNRHEKVLAEKRCITCKKKKAITKFHSKGKDRFESRCKTCSNEKKRRKRNQKNKERTRNRVYGLESFSVVGSPSSMCIDEFSRIYSQIIQEALDVQGEK